MAASSAFVGDFSDEAAVDLDARDRKAGQIVQRSIAGAEIVEREPDALFLQLQQRPGRVLVVERGVFGDLELERLGRQAACRQRLLDVLRKRVVVRLVGKQVDRDTAERKPHRPPRRRLVARRPDDPAADLGGDRAFRERLDECSGRQDAAHRVPPAQQRFGADHGLVREPDLRLEIELELVLGVGPSELEIEPAPGLRLRAQHRQEEPAHAAAVGLGLVEREVGVRDQFVHVRAVIGRDGDAGAGADMEDVVVDGERIRQPFEDRLDDVADDARVPAARDDHHELVAAEPAHQADLAAELGDVDETLADLDEQLVAGRMTERIVDVLESVEVEQHDGCRPLAGVAGEQAPQLLLQREPIRQAGQLVVMREPPELLLGSLVIGDVLIRPRDVPHRAVEVVHRGRRRS